MPPTPAETARAYHSVTKHLPDRYARSLGYMDWDSQPDPFRRFAGAAEVQLPLANPCSSLRWKQAIHGEAACNDPSLAAGLGRVGRLLEISLGLTAWKEFEGNRWSLRANPSSGNLHPTEGYVILPAGDAGSGHPAGVFHYAPREHLLELRCSLGKESAARLTELLPAGGFLVALSSVLWREAWKYGERAFRYCALDTGHALGAIDYAAACVGMRVAAVEGWTDAELAQLLGLDREADYAGLDAWDRELPDVLLALTPIAAESEGAQTSSLAFAPAEILSAMSDGTWHGRANELSEDHHEWDVIHATAAATARVSRSSSHGLADGTSATTCAEQPIDLDWPHGDAPLESILRGRRSAASMRAGVCVSLRTFARMLEATLVQRDAIPWRGWPREPAAHLVIFVHRVEGLEPGLYLLERNPSHRDELRAALRSDFAWERPNGLAESGFPDLGLFLLRAGNCESAARAISCQQDIAADGVFSLGMLSKFAPLIDADASHYRRLFWECGLVGQALYVEAEAAGLRATGIGCFLDDMMHGLLGVKDDQWQVLYHFTVGEPIEDARLEIHPPYAHLDRARG